MAAALPVDGASSISVAVRVRPFTIQEAAQLTRNDEGPLFLGDGSMAAVPKPRHVAESRHYVGERIRRLHTWRSTPGGRA